VILCWHSGIKSDIIYNKNNTFVFGKTRNLSKKSAVKPPVKKVLQKKPKVIDEPKGNDI
jgi:hypothetical protein